MAARLSLYINNCILYYKMILCKKKKRTIDGAAVISTMRVKSLTLLCFLIVLFFTKYIIFFYAHRIRTWIIRNVISFRIALNVKSFFCQIIRDVPQVLTFYHFLMYRVFRWKIIIYLLKYYTTCARCSRERSTVVYGISAGSGKYNIVYTT